MQLTGAQIVIECLKEQGVDTVFGYPGGAILNVYDELYKHQNEIRHVLTGSLPCSGRLCKKYRKSRGMPCNIGAGCDKSGHWYCDCIHGFSAGRGNYL